MRIVSKLVAVVIFETLYKAAKIEPTFVSYLKTNIKVDVSEGKVFD